MIIDLVRVSNEGFFGGAAWLASHLTLTTLMKGRLSLSNNSDESRTSSLEHTINQPPSPGGSELI